MFPCVGTILPRARPCLSALAQEERCDVIMMRLSIFLAIARFDRGRAGHQDELGCLEHGSREDVLTALKPHLDLHTVTHLRLHADTTRKHAAMCRSIWRWCHRPGRGNNHTLHLRRASWCKAVTQGLSAKFLSVSVTAAGEQHALSQIIL